MKNTILTICLLSSVCFLAGCKSKPKYIYLDMEKENIAKLKPSKVNEICIISNHFHDKMVSYTYDFTIMDPKKIETIIKCIKDANQIDNYYQQVLWPSLIDDKWESDKNISALRQNRRLIHFKTKKVIYDAAITWNDETVYGFWWQSAELLKHFKKWNLFEDIEKADPNFPPPDWTKNPPKDQTAPESQGDYNAWWD